MSKKAMIIGFMGQNADEQKIDRAIKTAVEEYGITEFFFGNEQDETEIDENETIKKFMSDSVKANKTIAEKIKLYKEKHKDKNIKSVMVKALPNDKNFSPELYDEIIEGYSIYYGEIEENSSDAYQLRDEFLVQNVDFIFWYSNDILINQSPLCKGNLEKIVVL